MPARSRWVGAALAVACIAALFGCAPDPVHKDGFANLKLAWSDEFNGAAGTLPDATKWNFVTGGGGFGNSELECYTNAPGNVSQNGKGDLVITAIRQPGHICSDGSTNDYTSARINTENKFTAKYGRLEIRAKVPTSSGTWPAFWALGDDHETAGWPASGEIDVMEVVGNAPRTVHGTLHGPQSRGGPYSVARTIDTGTDLAGKYHTFAADWTPSAITFLLDGKSYGTITAQDIENAGGKWVYTHPFYLLLNLAVGGNFPGTPSPDATWPQSYSIDYVRVYTSASD